MGKYVHIVVDVDEAAGKLTCANCGVVRMVRDHGRPKCSVGRHEQRHRPYKPRKPAVLRRDYQDDGYVQWMLGREYIGLEHRIVMERELGRALYDGEYVHHKNGVRDDNEPDNLELWVTSQPPGQRPEDLVAWAKVILERYG